MNDAANTYPTGGEGYCSIHRVSYWGGCPYCVSYWPPQPPPTVTTNTNSISITDILRLLEEIKEELRGLREVIDKQSSPE